MAFSHLGAVRNYVRDFDPDDGDVDVKAREDGKEWLRYRVS